MKFTKSQARSEGALQESLAYKEEPMAEVTIPSVADNQNNKENTINEIVTGKLHRVLVH